MVVGVWLAIYGIAVATGNWHSTVPLEVCKQVINSGLLQPDSGIPGDDRGS